MAPWLPFDTNNVAAVAGKAVSDANSGATYLAMFADDTAVGGFQGFALGSSEWMNAFYGLVPGSMGKRAPV